MRILTVVTDLGIGGTQRVAQNMTQGVQMLGHDVAVLAWKGGGPRGAQLSASGIRLFVNQEKDGDAGLESVLEAAATWAPDIVHIHRTGYSNETETRILERLRRAKARVVETNVFSRYDDGPARDLIDLHCQLSRWCMLKWNLWRRAGGRNAVGTILPYCVDIGRFTPIDEADRTAFRRELGLADGVFLFGRIGQPAPAKWAPEIFDVFAKDVARDPAAALLLVGAPAHYPALANGLPPEVRARIIFRDSISDDARLRIMFGSMNAFIHMAHIGESFGMVLCEAMLCGTPVLTLSTPLKDNSQLEVVGHERGGLVALDLDGMAQAMALIRTDGALRQRLAASARASVVARFSIPAISKQACALYEAVLASTSQEDLASRLAQTRSSTTDTVWMKQISTNGLGRPPRLRQRTGFRLVHHPRLYKAYLAVRQRVSGI